MATGPNFAPPLPLMQPPACRLLDPPNSPPIDPFLADRLRNHRHLAIAPASSRAGCASEIFRSAEFIPPGPAAFAPHQGNRLATECESSKQSLLFVLCGPDCFYSQFWLD